MIKKTLIFVFFVGIILFLSMYQSLLIDRKVSDIPFTPNIFVNSSSVKDVSVLEEEFEYRYKAYSRKLNDSLKFYHIIHERESFNNKVIGAIWKIKYKNMNAENLLEYLDGYNLFLSRELNGSKELLGGEKNIFLNENIHQYLVGSYDKKDGIYRLKYDYPEKYIPHEKLHAFRKNIKDILIGAPR